MQTPRSNPVCTCKEHNPLHDKDKPVHAVQSSNAVYPQNRLHTLWVAVNEDMTDVASCGTCTYHRGLNAECSPIHSAYCTTLPSSPVTAQFICPVLPYPSSPCRSILLSARGWPPSLSISLAAHKTVIQTLLVVCGVRVQRAVIAAGWSLFVIRNADGLL